MKIQGIPYPKCPIKKNCYFVVFYKYPKKKKRLTGNKLQILENGKVIKEVPIKHPIIRECLFCNLYHNTLHRDRDIELTFELPKDSIPPILGPNIASKEDWKTWFEKLGISKKYWNEPRGFFFRNAELGGLNTDEYKDNRDRFEQMIEREWNVDKKKDEDRVNLFWHYLLMNCGLTIKWYVKQNQKTDLFQKYSRLKKQAYEKIKKSEKKLTNEEIEVFKIEVEKELARLIVPGPVFYPMEQYDEPHRPEDKGYLEFIRNFVNLLKGLKDNRNQRIFKIISVFYDCFVGVSLKPSNILKAYLRSLKI